VGQEDDDPPAEEPYEAPDVKTVPRESRGHRARSRSLSTSSGSSSSSSSTCSSRSSSASSRSKKRHRKKRGHHSHKKDVPVTRRPPSPDPRHRVQTVAQVHAPTYPPVPNPLALAPVGPANTAHTHGNTPLCGPVTLAGVPQGHSVPLHTVPLIPPARSQPLDPTLPVNVLDTSPTVTTASSAATHIPPVFQKAVSEQ
jgi:hypothetical protein